MVIPPVLKRIKSKLAFTLIELLVVISIIAILAGIALPVFSSVQIKGAQTKDLSNAKQIGLGLRLYASDNSGLYPTSAPSGTTAATSSNEAFRSIVPQYIPQEKIFYLAKSAWTPKPPDEITSVVTSVLTSGENNFSYVMGLNDTSNPSWPLIADGFSASAANVDTYSTNAQAQGGVWAGKNAIVIRADNSGAVEKVTSSKVLGITAPDTGSSNDIFSATTNWLTSCTILNPL